MWPRTIDIPQDFAHIMACGLSVGEAESVDVLHP